jgi:2-keto-4-pentenoate hydratase/2-oxohepta-3-ene-1,7-dioic acid hydratase in catechol pathway
VAGYCVVNDVSEREYQLDRQRITDDCERSIEAIRRQAD